MPKPKCVTCECFVAGDIKADRGECHVYPPNPAWPIVKKSDFCGKHPKFTETRLDPEGVSMIKSVPRKLKLWQWIWIGIILIGFVLSIGGIWNAYAVNTITYEQGTINIVPDGATDFKWSEISEASSQGLIVYSIQFNPSAANDRIKVRHGTTAGTLVWDTNPAGSTAPLIKYFPQGKRIKLVIADSDCTYTTPGNAMITIETKNRLR